MSSKIAHYLQEHLLGEVTDSLEARQYFSQDASILRLEPSVIVYPRNESDIRKVAHFSWQLAQRGSAVPITARGGGSNTSGSAIGNGVVLVFTAHMNKIKFLDSKKGILVVEPGATYDKAEQTLFTHGLFLPPCPASQHYATIGGAVATNAIGEKSLKYGPTGDFVNSLRVVLSNGEVIEVGHLSKRELSQKMGLATFEGDIYRALDRLLEENSEIVEKEKQHLQDVRSSVGYDLFSVRTKRGFDLTPLFIGAQGTLGLITEARMEVLPYNHLTHLAMASLSRLEDLREVQAKILELKPSVLDMINKAAIDLITKINPNQLGNLVDNPSAAVHLFVEFDNPKSSDRENQIKKLQKIVSKIGGSINVASDPDSQDKITKIRESVSTILAQSDGQVRALPIAEDVSVPPSKVVNFLNQAADIYEKNRLVSAAWGHVGDGVIRMQPMLNLSEVGDRQKLFKVSEAIYDAAIVMGGSISAAAGDGRIRSPYAYKVFSHEYYELMAKVKKIFDPYNILNPGVKFTSIEELKTLIRDEYSLGRHDHLPRS